MREASGEFCLLLNEDSELLDGAVRALLEALGADRGAAVAGAQLLDPDGEPIPCAWRFPEPGDGACPGALPAPPPVTQSHGGDGPPRQVGWVQSCAMLVRREAADEVGYLDPDFFVYSEEVDFQKRLHDAGWRILHVPRARAIHHEQLATDRSPGGRRRIVEFHRGRDLYMRKHHSQPVVRAVAPALVVVVRSAGARRDFLPRPGPGHLLAPRPPGAAPGSGEGMREAADAYNAAHAPGGQVPERSSSRAATS